MKNLIILIISAVFSFTILGFAGDTPGVCVEEKTKNKEVHSELKVRERTRLRLRDRKEMREEKREMKREMRRMRKSADR